MKSYKYNSIYPLKFPHEEYDVVMRNMDEIEKRGKEDSLFANETDEEEWYRLYGEMTKLQRTGSFALARYLRWKYQLHNHTDVLLSKTFRDNKEIIETCKRLSKKCTILELDPDNETLLPELVKETKEAFIRFGELGFPIVDKFPEFK